MLQNTTLNDDNNAKPNPFSTALSNESETIEWTDITSLCREAAQGELNEVQSMIHTTTFSLYESMSAMELMDPKMDQSYGMQGDRQIDRLLKVTSAEMEQFQVSHVIQLFQKVTCLEVLFLVGYSIMETVLKCKFAWRETWKGLSSSDNLMTKVILEFFRNLNQLNGHVFKAIMAADVYEDDDFQPSYRSHISDGMEEIPQLNRVMEELSQSMKPSDGMETGRLVRMLQVFISFESLCHRLGDWIHGSIAHHAAMVRRSNGLGLKPSTTHAMDVDLEDGSILLLKEGLQSMTDIQDLSHRLVQLVEPSHEEVVSGTETSSPYPSREEDSQTMDQWAFSENLVRLHQTHTVQSIPHLTYPEAVQKIQSIALQIKQVADIGTRFYRHMLHSVSTTSTSASTTSVITSSFDIETILYQSIELSHNRLHLLPRSLYIGILYTLYPHFNLLIQRSMTHRGLPVEVTDRDIVLNQWIGASPSQSIWETVKCCCGNRSKLFGKMESILSAWSVVSSDAILLDNDHHREREAVSSHPSSTSSSTTHPASTMEEKDASIGMKPQQWLTSWSIVLITRLMHLTMELMMESDLLDANELDYYFWYWDYLLNTRSFAWNALRKLRYEYDLHRYEASMMQRDLNKLKIGESESIEGKDGKKNRKKDKKKDKDKKKSSESEDTCTQDKKTDPADSVAPSDSVVPPTVRPFEVSELLVMGRSNLCKGIFRMVIVAVQLGLIGKRPGRFMSWTKKFNQRFKAFSTIYNPPMLAYEDYLKTLKDANRRPDVNLSMDDDASGEEGEGDPDVSRYNIDGKAVLNGALQCFQNARKYLDEARKIHNKDKQLLDEMPEVEKELLILTKVRMNDDAMA